MWWQAHMFKLFWYTSYWNSLQLEILIQAHIFATIFGIYKRFHFKVEGYTLCMCIRMSQWCHTMVDGAKFWISCKWTAFLSSFSPLQVIQNLVPSIIVRGQCAIWIAKLQPFTKMCNIWGPYLIKLIRILM